MKTNTAYQQVKFNLKKKIFNKIRVFSFHKEIGAEETRVPETNEYTIYANSFTGVTRWQTL